MLILVVLALGIAAIYIFAQMGGAEAAKDGAVADAASDVGNAAGQVGDAAQDAADNLSE